MMIGTVLGQLRLERSVPGAEGKRFVRVQCGGTLLAALDPVGARDGEQVLLTAGEGASRYCLEAGVDAVVLGVADFGNNG